MQDVCGWMKKAFDASAADCVTSPSQTANESSGQNDRDRVQPKRSHALCRQEVNEQTAEHASQHEAQEPVAAEIGLRQHGPQHPLRGELAQRLAAHRLRDEDKPGHSGEYGPE